MAISSKDFEKLSLPSQNSLQNSKVSSESHQELSQSSAFLFFDLPKQRPDCKRLILQPGEEEDTNLQCMICQMIVFDPAECESCQNLFCMQCITEWKKKKDQCPSMCPSPIKLNKCQFQDNGCMEIINLENLVKHEKNCDFQMIPCPNSQQCQSLILKKNLSLHNENCEYYIYKCCHCDCSFTKQQKSSHNCTQYLKQLIKIIDIKIEQQNEQILQKDEMIKQQQQQINDLQNIVEILYQMNKKENRNCPKGHILQWVQEYGNCNLCKKSNSYCRYACNMCKQLFCVACIKPQIKRNNEGKLTCPIGHIIEEHPNGLQNNLCDSCRIGLKNVPSISDRQCDFDLCKKCQNF